VESDLASDKKTLPVVYALSLGQSFTKQWKPGPKTIQEVTAFVDLLEKEGAEEYTLNETDRLTNEALQELENAGCNNEGEENLKSLAGQLLHRSW
jgi:geranylgeranyl pyrophosphate synthase